MPGLVGLNNMKSNDYANVVLQIFARVPTIRDFFLWPEGYGSCKSELVQRFGELLRKMWNTQNFKGQVSPHEFMQVSVRVGLLRAEHCWQPQAAPVEVLAGWVVGVACGTRGLLSPVIERSVQDNQKMLKLKSKWHC